MRYFITKKNALKINQGTSSRNGNGDSIIAIDSKNRKQNRGFYV